MNLLLTNFSDHLQNAQLAALMFDTLLKSFVVLALAGGICALWRRSSAATRHLIWLLAVASLPCLPLLNHLTQPSWQRPLWTISTGSDSGNQISLAFELTPKPTARTSSAAPVVAETFPANQVSGGGGRKVAAQFSANWMVFGLAAWFAGACFVLISVAAGQFRLRQFSRNARRLDGACWARLLAEARESMRLRRAVTLLQSPNDVMPLTWGWWRPVVLLPADAENWSAERRRIVLLHELAHVKRRDCLTQLVVQIICAMYWFNPLVWLAARQMRAERELACDDLVLAGGCKASDYAGHLVDIAVSFRRVPQMAAIAMARPSGLEQRVEAILDGRRNRNRIAKLTVVFLVAGFLSLSWLIGSYAAENSIQPWTLKNSKVAEQLKRFVAEKKAQEETLIKTDETDFARNYANDVSHLLLPDCQPFFAAAAAGDWQTLTNIWSKLEAHTLGLSQATNGYPHGMWLQPMRETFGAIEAFAVGNEKYSKAFADEVVQSIPPSSVYFGGTDHGRFVITAMQKSHVHGDPFFTLTQNALADGTYLDYLRKTYGDAKILPGRMVLADKVEQMKTEISTTQLEIAEAQKDGDSERRAARASDLERKAKIQRRNLEYYESILEESSRDIYIPTSEDSQKCFQDYVADAQVRLNENRLKPGEDIKVTQGRVQVSGRTAVMEINALLVKIIFDKNPGREFYLEESFPLDRMYPNLEPHALIFKINRQPLAEISDTMVRQDRDYWQKLVPGMIGGWLADDTSVQEITAFAEKIYVLHDLHGFTGDPGYVQNDYTSRMFSKLRSAQAGLYAWRAEHAATSGEKERMARAADFAFRQAVALCPVSAGAVPEAVKNYASFLNSQHRDADARLVQNLADYFKPQSRSVFQLRLVVDETAADAEKMIMLSTNQSTGQVRQEVLFVAKPVLLDQTALQSAKLITGPQGDRQIELTFTSAGREKFAELTREYLHQKLAIVVDDRLLCAPVIQSEIPGGTAQITGSFSEDEAAALAAKLNAAAGK